MFALLVTLAANWHICMVPRPGGCNDVQKVSLDSYVATPRRIVGTNAATAVVGLGTRKHLSPSQGIPGLKLVTRAKSCGSFMRFAAAVAAARSAGDEGLPTAGPVSLLVGKSTALSPVAAASASAIQYLRRTPSTYGLSARANHPLSVADG